MQRIVLYTHAHTHTFVHMYAPLHKHMVICTRVSGLRHTGLCLCWIVFCRCVLNIWFGLLCFRPPRPGTPETQRKSSVQTSSPAMQSQIKQGNYKEKLAFKMKSRNMKNSARTTKHMLLTKSKEFKCKNSHRHTETDTHTQRRIHTHTDTYINTNTNRQT